MPRWRDMQSTLAHEMDWETARKAMRAISKAYGGEAFYVPKLPRVDRTAVREAVNRGTPAREVARVHGVTVRHVRRIVRGV